MKSARIAGRAEQASLIQVSANWAPFNLSSQPHNWLVSSIFSLQIQGYKRPFLLCPCRHLWNRQDRLGNVTSLAIYNITLSRHVGWPALPCALCITPNAQRERCQHRPAVASFPRTKDFHFFQFFLFTQVFYPPLNPVSTWEFVSPSYCLST